jgi:hypothetical protein
MKWLSSLVVGCALLPGLAACEGDIGTEEPVPPPIVLQAPRPVADESDVERFLGQWVAVSGNTREACESVSGTSEEVPLASVSLSITPGPGPGQVTIDGDDSSCLIHATVSGDQAFAGGSTCPRVTPSEGFALLIFGDTLIAEVTVQIDTPKL